MPNNNSKFLSAQKGEINAALMYRQFASITKDPELKEIFRTAAADEGRHAKILSKYTNATVTPSQAQAKVLGFLYRILPKKTMFAIISKGEVAGGDGYKPYIEQYPEFEQMMVDEYHHAETFGNLAK